MLKKTYILLIIFISLFVYTSFSPAKSNPYVILISFDGFRWDYANRGITPNLDSIKKYGVSALSLKPTFPSKTFPNHYSIITGMYPEHHGIIANRFINPFNGEEYRVGDSISVRDSKWYKGEAFWETAERQGIITASYFWPGSEVKLAYRHPTYYKPYVHTRPYIERINGVLNWLKMPYEKRPHFITLYFDATDTYGHKFGPNSPEVNNAIQNLDSQLGSLLRGLSLLGLKDSTDIILVSDHGMTEINNKKVINIQEMLKGYNCQYSESGPVLMIKPQSSQEKEILHLLKKHQNNFKVYKRANVPGYFKYSSNPFIFPIVLIADLGYTLTDNKGEKMLAKYNGKGNHGYDNNSLDMHGIFFAVGPDFKSGYRTGTLWNIDIYPLLSKIFNIIPNQNIDGQLDRIEFILK